jgi:anti-sigma factor RsiW
LTCRVFADFMMDYLSGDAPSDVRRVFERHLTLCVNCQKYLQSYRETVRLGQRAFDDEDADLPGDVPEELVNAIVAARRL